MRLEKEKGIRLQLLLIWSHQLAAAVNPLEANEAKYRNNTFKGGKCGDIANSLANQLSRGSKQASGG